MVSGVLAVLGRLWIVFLACLRGAEITTTQPTILPLATKSPAGPRLQNRQKRPNERAVDTDPLAAWQESKQQFLRHPSLRRSTNRQPMPKPDKGKKRERYSRFVPPTFMIQDWTYTQKPPRRPPRPPSGPVPAVIVTPCTPTMSLHHDFSDTPTPAPRVSPLVYSTGNEDIPMKAVAREKPTKPSKIAESAELNIDLEEDSLFNSPRNSAPIRGPRRSLNIPDSVKTIGFGPSHVLSVASDTVCDEPSWTSDISVTERLVARVASYITSTPAKRRLDTLIEESEHSGSPQINIISSPYNPVLTDAEKDTLPYPDVFDIDMYYGAESHRISIPRRVQNPSSKNRRSLQVRNRGSTSSNSSPDVSIVEQSPRSVKRFGYIPDSQTGNKSISPIHEVKRYRDHYRPPAYTFPPSQVSPNSSGESSAHMGKPLPLPPKPSKTSRVLTPSPLGNITNASSPTTTKPGSFSSHSTAGRFPYNEPSPSPIKEPTHMYPPPPIVVISHHRFSSYSLTPDESRLTGSEGSQELRDRLREACDNFAKSVWTEDSYSMEAVALN
ncbi:hypothetical protein JR316_0006356 [Psilocybe cubensis]|uniref:Uncharacterized protein n=2 Tax=Psilocybe cubensis TaxID=181762 RepID=A0A8H7XJL1_PSICU|nr:hypothetical protein JR316_0006356 [Psilocybe cubensis]KAH9481826.1 hypothetical protein JR316_0006356 [Psilocybe cubensis]